ncbi:hypothetical protein [Cysteiniphilum litorale]|uniref:hypothetical protein n=1 Tax=Cysteiniphilum litorale TaxID=2056700 RepID=UPI003F883620
MKGILKNINTILCLTILSMMFCDGAFASVNNNTTKEEFEAYKSTVDEKISTLTRYTDELQTLFDQSKNRIQDELKSYYNSELNKNPFYRLSKNQMGNLKNSMLEHYDICPMDVDLTFEIRRTIKTDVLWENRDEEEKQILTAMGRANQRYFQPSSFNIVSMKWRNASKSIARTGNDIHARIFHQFVNYHKWITVASYAKLISGKIVGFYFEGVNENWSLCGVNLDLSAHSYTHTHPYALTDTGEIWFALPAVVAGYFPLSKDNPQWGYFPKLVIEE